MRAVRVSALSDQGWDLGFQGLGLSDLGQGVTVDDLNPA